jgi:hypothetical protein
MTEKTLYQNISTNSNKNYNTKEITRLIILIKKSAKQDKISEYKYQLFIGLSKIVLKAVNNFFSICKNYDVPEEKIIHEGEDIVIECFLVLEKCLENVNLKYLKMFFFYFNSGLNRAMFRIYKKNYEKYANTVVNTEENENYVMGRIKYNHHFDFTGIDLASFTEIELAIVEHKLDNGKLKDFLKENDLPAIRYYEIWAEVQAKIFEIYKDPETNKLEY